MSFVKFRFDVKIRVHNLIENQNHSMILKIGFTIIQPLYLSKINLLMHRFRVMERVNQLLALGVVHFSCLIRVSRYFILFKWILLQTRRLRFSISTQVQILLRLWIVT